MTTDRLTTSPRPEKGRGLLSSGQSVSSNSVGGATSVKVYPHVLRHTFIVGALDAGTPARTVQLSARHAQVSTTLSVYDRGRQVLDDHAAYVVAGYFGAA